jgi:transcription-repair coupling factor (superfamily II helicase)
MRLFSSPAIALRQKIQEDPIFKGLQIPQQGQRTVLGGLPGASKALLVAALREQVQDRPIILCLAEEFELQDWAEDLLLFSPLRLGRPAPKILPEARREDGEWLLGSLPARRSMLKTLGPEDLCLMDLSRLMAQVGGKECDHQETLTLMKGEELEIQEVTRRLKEVGFIQVPLVEGPGEFRSSGDILDIYPLTQDQALRVEFFDQEIETIRSLDTNDQRSKELMERAEIPLPKAKKNKENQSLEQVFPLDLLEKALVVVVEPIRFEEHLSRFTLLAGSLSAPVEAFQVGLKRLGAISLSALPGSDSLNFNFEAPKIPIADSGDLKGRLLAAGRLKDNMVIVLRSEPEAKRLQSVAKKTLHGQSLQTAVGNLSRGFRIPWLQTQILSHGEFFGIGAARRHLQHRREKKAPRSELIQGFFDLQVGDLIVHAIHGIGRFRGLERGSRGASGGQEEHLRLEFRDEVEILVPATMIDLVQKYVGSGDAGPRLDKVGGKAFGKRKAQVAMALKDMAAELLELQVKRSKHPGFACPKEDPLAKEFEKAFPFEDTVDQVRGTKEITKDLQQTKPMDRLLCGDVGFGKTELAVRAAFRMVSAGKQTAILVPTTLLAEQHGRTFRDRMSTFGARVEVLSRLRTPKEKRKILEALKNGQVDVLVGTHRILSKDVIYKDLGFLVIDEEQRFGVAQKEKIRKVRATLDVLSMTATPIPRTLHMALLGIKDISSLTTPPPGRLEIRTKVVERSSALIRNAILGEIHRGGQVFFLHNKVRDLHVILEELQSLVPEARFVMGHGQMTEKELLLNMNKFLRGESDVLLSTTIVESGIDIPRANTILVDNADHFGLAELHQLRGRVGRDIMQAWCYLLTDPSRPLSPEGKKRLEAMERFSELGSGFSIAMKDLEIRGAGNLLGPQQSGHIAAIGYDMYCKLLQSAVERSTKGTVSSHEIPEVLASNQVDVDFGVEAFIPTNYVSDPSLRMKLLREMDSYRDQEGQRNLLERTRDRFGRIPSPVRTLSDVFLTKNLLALEGILSARFEPPDRIILKHQPGRGPHGAWLRNFQDIRPISGTRTDLILRKKRTKPESALAFFRDTLLGKARGGRIKKS